jgi:hypothetical protein
MEKTLRVFISTVSKNTFPPRVLAVTSFVLGLEAKSGIYCRQTRQILGFPRFFAPMTLATSLIV